MGQVGAVLALVEKLTMQIDQCEQIESENQDCDEAGITGSQKLRYGTREQSDKFKAVQRDTNAILAQARALSSSQLDTLQKVEYRLDDLGKNRDNML